MRRCFSRWSEPRDVRHRLGREGERLAERYLKQHDYKILRRNFRASHGGEVDLVCRDRSCDTLAFVEVKTRTRADFSAPADAVGAEKQALIARGAMAWLRMLDDPDVPYRFDIVEVVVGAEERPGIHLIKDAFPLPKPYF